MNLFRYVALLGFLMLPTLAEAQNLTLDLGTESDGQTTARIIQLLALITILSLAPSILVMVTSFTRIIVVFSILRSALGLQQTPPNSVLISLALFITFFIMQPVFMASYNEGIKPLMENELTEEEAISPTLAPFHQFMADNAREEDIALFLRMSEVDMEKEIESVEDIPMHVMIPAFMISELRRAFEIGFLVFVPFLIIDMVIASTLMAMGMMMLPPVLISLPFKLIFFVLVDGWHLITSSLIQSYNMAPV